VEAPKVFLEITDALSKRFELRRIGLQPDGFRQRHKMLESALARICHFASSSLFTHVTGD
jgi:hypothetical protein